MAAVSASTSMSIGLVFLALLLCSTVAFGASPPYDGHLRPGPRGEASVAYLSPIAPSSHGSFIEILPSGDLVLVWYTGEMEGYDCAEAVSVLGAHSSTWGHPEVVFKKEGFASENPVLLANQALNTLFLFFSMLPNKTPAIVTPPPPPPSPTASRGLRGERGLGGPEYLAQVYMMSRSFDNDTWSAPQPVLTKLGSFLRNRFIQGLDGSWLLPIYYSTLGYAHDYSQLQRNTNDWFQRPWETINFNQTSLLIQPTIVRYPRDSPNLLALFRDKLSLHIYRSVSADDGHSWSAAEPTELPNNDSAIEAIVLQSGRIALVFNPTTDARVPLRIALSEDHGLRWPYFRDLELLPKNGSQSLEYSYPSLVQDREGYIHISYTYLRETIKYVKITEDWILQGSS